jgi:hypothetical protein
MDSSRVGYRLARKKHAFSSYLSIFPFPAVLCFAFSGFDFSDYCVHFGGWWCILIIPTRYERLLDNRSLYFKD